VKFAEDKRELGFINEIKNIRKLFLFFPELIWGFPIIIRGRCVVAIIAPAFFGARNSDPIMEKFKGSNIKIPPPIMEKWQRAVDIIAELLGVEAALIMRGTPPEIEVLASSHSKGNPYKAGEKENLAGLYCEYVMQKKEKLHVKNAREDERWKDNPDLKLGMISYLGFPLQWPDGNIFGTLCALSSREKRYKEKEEKLFRQFKELVASHLHILFQNHELEQKIKERNAFEKSLDETRVEYKEVVETINEGILIQDERGIISFANTSAGTLLGLEWEKLIGENIKRFFDTEKKIPEDKEQENFDLAFKRKDGEEKIFNVTKSQKKIGPDLKTLISFRDISESKKQEEKIRYLSLHDNLTDLYNRYFLEEEYKRLDRGRQLPTCLILADVNGLKMINDSRGHSEGDRALRMVGQILEKSCREEDIVARWGGDEFLALLPQTSEEEGQKICLRIKENCTRADENYPISLSLGLAVKANPGETLSSLFKIAEDRMYDQKALESGWVKSDILKSLLKTLSKNSSETEGHARRMQALGNAMGKKIGLSKSELEKLSLLAMVHDVGKTTIPEEILLKPGGLTPIEWNKIKQHPITGFKIASSTEEFVHVANLILYHHEWWDGSGYPYGKKGKDIPLLSRIIAIVDAYEVMTSGRPYREPISSEEAVEELKRNAGTQFDPELVDVFARIYDEKGDLYKFR